VSLCAAVSTSPRMMEDGAQEAFARLRNFGSPVWSGGTEFKNRMTWYRLCAADIQYMLRQSNIEGAAGRGPAAGAGVAGAVSGDGRLNGRDGMSSVADWRDALSPETPSAATASQWTPELERNWRGSKTN
jgi:hypothetical protein